MDQAAANWTNFLLVLLIAWVVVVGGVLLAGFQLLFGYVQIIEEVVIVGSSWQSNHLGWSRPLFPYQYELASLDYAQLEAARLSHGWRAISRTLSYNSTRVHTATDPLTRISHWRRP